MPLNAEEMHAQKEYETKQKNLLQSEIDYLEMELASIEEELKHSYNINSHLNYGLDKRIEQLDKIGGACQQVMTDPEFSDGLFKDRILNIMGVVR